MHNQPAWESLYSITAGAQPQTNDEVCFIDGTPMGTVLVAGRDGFKVRFGDVQLWLRAEAIFTRAGGRITLVCEPAGLHRYATVPSPR